MNTTNQTPDKPPPHQDSRVDFIKTRIESIEDRLNVIENRVNYIKQNKMNTEGVIDSLDALDASLSSVWKSIAIVERYAVGKTAAVCKNEI